MGTFQKSRDRTVACSRQRVGGRGKPSPCCGKELIKVSTPGICLLELYMSIRWMSTSDLIMLTPRCSQRKGHFISIHLLCLWQGGTQCSLSTEGWPPQVCPDTWEPREDTLSLHGHITSPTKQSGSQAIKDLCWFNQANFRIIVPSWCRRAIKVGISSLGLHLLQRRAGCHQHYLQG